MTEHPPTNVVLFGKKQRPKRPEISLLATPAEAAPALKPPSTAIDLTGKTKIILLFGMGGVGKSTLARWIIDYKTKPLILASVAVNRTLARFYPNVLSPEYQTEQSAVQLLEDLFNVLHDTPQDVLIDFPGGDGSLLALLRQAPKVFEQLEAKGMFTVGLFPMSTREEDLTPLAQLTAAGFNPKATGLVLNIGRTPDPTLPAGPQFDRVTEHTAFQSALRRKAVALWMPRLYCAPQIEENELLFSEAASGVLPEEKRDYGLSFTDQMKASDWERQMKDAFKPIVDKGWFV